jgi:hypothetical protein
MLTELVIIGLAAWRLALFLVDDVGPFGVMNTTRRVLHADVEVRRQEIIAEIYRGRSMTAGALGGNSIAPFDESDVTVEPNGWEKLWSCMRCMSAWTALGLYGLWQLDQRPVEVLAIWGLAQMVDLVRTGGA